MIYRKWGRVARWEHGTVVVIDEAGEAVEERGVFEARPSVGTGGLARPAAGKPPTATQVSNFAQRIGRIGHPERLVVSHGIAEHEINGIRWSEETRRVHLSLTGNGMRVLIDRGDFEFDEIERIANALKRAGSEREAPRKVRLAPNVTAALLPSLVGKVEGATLHQTGGGYDGYGKEIVEAEMRQPPWPNAFRPSYRIRPQFMPMNLRLECANTEIDGSAPRAIALLEPVHGTTLRVLMEDGNDIYPSTVDVKRIDAVSRERIWYPYGAGAFGSEIML